MTRHESMRPTEEIASFIVYNQMLVLDGPGQKFCGGNPETLKHLIKTAIDAERLRAEELGKDNETNIKWLYEAEKKLAQLQAKIEDYERVLMEYARREEWSKTYTHSAWKLVFNSEEYDGDGYSMAENVLAKYGEGGK